MAFANLHIHTYFSDGLTSPDDLAKRIFNEDGLEYFALTDHDNMSGVEPVFRSMSRIESNGHPRHKRFIPGVELSLLDESTGLTVHIIGLFPNINEENLQDELLRIDSTIGDFCRYRGENRAIKDLDARITRAFEINLEGIADNFDSAETVIRILRDKANASSRIRFQENEKEQDIIQHPVPATYQTIIDHWEELLPLSTKEKVTLYVLRPARSKMEKLARIYMAEGMEAPKAMQLAEKNQGTLVGFGTPGLKEISILEGLALLQEAKAITILSHPAVDHNKIGYDDFDHHILNPLIQNGIDGIEVYYPYDLTYRDEAIRRYYDIAKRHRLLISGGTDFHGDDRTGLSDIKLEVDHALKIIQRG
jgi:predicted metal-dependent phosphoesterase TrpH